MSSTVGTAPAPASAVDPAQPPTSTTNTTTAAPAVSASSGPSPEASTPNVPVSDTDASKPIMSASTSTGPAGVSAAPAVEEGDSAATGGSPGAVDTGKAAEGSAPTTQASTAPATTTPTTPAATATPSVPATTPPTTAPLESAAAPHHQNTAATNASASLDLEKEKALSPSSSATHPKSTPAPSPASKKRRKRGGLAAIFVALGCLSSDDFEDMPPSKSAPPANAAQTGTQAGATGSGSGSGSKPTTATSAASKSAPAVANSANAAAVPASSKAAGAATTSTGNAANAGAGASGSDANNKNDPNNLAMHDDVSEHGLVIHSNDVQRSTAPLDETAGLMSGAVQPPGSGSEIIHQHMLHRNESQHNVAHPPSESGAPGTPGAADTTSGSYTDVGDAEHLDEQGNQEMLYSDEEYEDEEDRLIAQGGIGIPVDENGNECPLLPAIDARDTGRKCLVLDLDETLLHSSFKMLPSADYIVPVEIESQTHNVYVIKRPGVDHFLQEMGKIYEVVVFTASLSKYADPVLDMLDVGRVVRHRLFRESCYNHKGNYVKDLSQLGRDLSTSIIIDNSPASYIFHPNNAVPVSTWFNDPHDTELTDLCPFLTDLATVDDVRGVLDGGF